jgi:hypothetical protein
MRRLWHVRHQEIVGKISNKVRNMLANEKIRRVLCEVVAISVQQMVAGVAVLFTKPFQKLQKDIFWDHGVTKFQNLAWRTVMRSTLKGK